MHEHDTHRPIGEADRLFEPPEPATPHAPFAPRAPRGQALAAWIVIILVVAFIIVGRQLAERADESSREDPIGLMLMEFQAKYMVAAHQVSGFRERDYQSVRGTLNRGTVDQRHRFIIFAAELRDVEEARDELEQLDSLLAAERSRRGFELDEREERTHWLLHKLYGDESIGAPNVAALDADDRDWLVNELGWFGELALAHPDVADRAARAEVLRPARRVMLSFLAVVIGGGLVGLAGFAGLVVLIVLGFMGRLRSGLEMGRGPHGVYAETFAVWLVLFLGLQVLSLTVGKHVPYWALSINFIAFFASLAALAWPVLRGVPWATARRDFGLTLGERPPLEPLLGVAGYGMAVPFLVVGVLMTLALIALQAMLTGPEQDVFVSSAGPAHPVIGEVLGPHWWPKIQVLLLAAVAAPIVEEIMFRGVLYRHLRDATRDGGFAVSVLISAGINSFIFAIIHPQGWVAVPALGSLAFAFCLVREWRGTVVVPIIMHGISNGIVMGVVIFILAS